MLYDIYNRELSYVLYIQGLLDRAKEVSDRCKGLRNSLYVVGKAGQGSHFI
jgi:uncharacterized protein (DUF2164 family)